MLDARSRANAKSIEVEWLQGILSSHSFPLHLSRTASSAARIMLSHTSRTLRIIWKKVMTFTATYFFFFSRSLALPRRIGPFQGRSSLNPIDCHQRFPSLLTRLCHGCGLWPENWLMPSSSLLVRTFVKHTIYHVEDLIGCRIEHCSHRQGHGSPGLAAMTWPTVVTGPREILKGSLTSWR
jgi:hypothetical protein